MRFSPPIFFFSIIFPVISTYSQSFTFRNEISLSLTIDMVALDRQDQIYVTSKKGVILKLNAEGDSLQSYSSGTRSQISSLQVWNSLKVFLFYRDLQQFIFLDRFLTSSDPYTLIHDKISYAAFVALSSDQNVWIWDPVDYHLKKFNPSTNTVDLSVSMESQTPSGELEVVFMQEHHGQLFIVDESNGIYILDALGNVERYIADISLNTLGFIDSYFYHIDNGNIVFNHIYSDTKKILSVPDDLPETYHIVCLASRRAYFFSSNQIRIYDWEGI